MSRGRRPCAIACSTPTGRLGKPRRGAKSTLDAALLERFDIRFWDILREGFTFHRKLPRLPQAATGRPKRRPGENLLRRLHQFKDDVLRFLVDFEVPFTTDGADKRKSSARRSGHGRSSGWLFLPRRHHSLVGLLSTPHVVGFPLADLLDPVVPTWSRLAILAWSAGFERCFA